MNEHRLEPEDEERTSRGEVSDTIWTAEQEKEKVVDLEAVKAKARAKRKTQEAWSKTGRTAAIIVGLAAIIGASAPIVLRYEDQIGASKELSQTIAAYRATGLPWTADEIAPAAKPEENAAQLVNLASAQIKASGFKYDDVVKAIDAKNFGKATRLLGVIDPALETASLAIERPRLDFGRDWDAGPMIMFPEEDGMRSLARGFAYRAEVEAANGRAEACARDILNGRKVASLIGQEPILISYLVANGADSNVVTSAQRCAASLKDDPAGLKTLEDALSAPVPLPDFCVALRGEAYMEIVGGRNRILQDPRVLGGGGAPQVIPSMLTNQPVPDEVSTRATLDRILQCWTKVGEAMQRTKDPLAIARVLKDTEEFVASQPGVSYRISKIIFPIFDNAADSGVREKSLNESTRALIDALIQHAETGNYPPRIEDIPGKWIDPFSGGPLKVKATTDGTRIYGVGTDLKDYGGITRGEYKQLDKNGDDQGDVVSAYPPIARGMN